MGRLIRRVGFGGLEPWRGDSEFLHQEIGGLGWCLSRRSVFTRPREDTTGCKTSTGCQPGLWAWGSLETGAATGYLDTRGRVWVGACLGVSEGSDIRGALSV